MSALNPHSVRKSLRDAGIEFVLDHWVSLAGVIVSSMAAYLTAVTEAFKQSTPASWVVACLVTGLLISILHAAYQRAALWRAERRLCEIRTRPPTSVNPLRASFEDELIRVADFHYPMSEPYRGKTFTRCHIVGPGTIALSRATTLGVINSKTRFIATDIVALRKEAIHCSVIFEQCVFNDCTFHDLTMFVQVEMAAALASQGQRFEIIGFDAPPSHRRLGA